MTFLNPLVLAGLVAAAVPIIIHLLNLRRLRTIEFSTLQFLKELQRTKIRRLKIRQLLLLILRTLLIIVIVLAFSRPAMRGSLAGTIGTHAKSTLVIILDESPSMSVRDERGMMFAQARAATLNLLDLVKEGDEVYFLKLSEVRHKEQFSPVHSLDALRKALDQTAPSQETTSFQDALGAAAKILAESKNFNQEIYLLTDGQATQFTLGSPQDTADLFDDRVHFFLVEAGKGEPENYGVSSVNVKTRIITKNKPVHLVAAVENVGSSPVKDLLMSAYVDGARVAQHSLDIAPRSSATADVSFVPKRRGILQGYVQLEDDALEIDNKRFFVLDMPQEVRVLLIGAGLEETRLSSLALTAGENTNTTDLFTVLRITEDQLSSTDIGMYDVLIFCGVKDFSTSEADRVAQFVKDGGGIMIFPGKESSISNYNETLFAKLAIPSSQDAINIREDKGKPFVEGGGFLSFKNVDFDHPLFQELFEQPVAGKNTQPTIESPRVYKTIAPRAGPRGLPIIELSDGSVFLIEYTAGSGRVLLCSVDASLSWSDFPVKGLFAPLLHRASIYLASRNSTTPSFIVGQTIKLSVRTMTLGDRTSFIFKSPSGIEERAVPHPSSMSNTATLESSGTQEVGFYELRFIGPAQGNLKLKNANLIKTVAVNVDPAESDLRRISNDELSAFWSSIGVRSTQTNRVPVVEKIESTVLESRFGVELWKYFVGLAVLIALIEMAIARMPKSQELGVELNS